LSSPAWLLSHNCSLIRFDATTNAANVTGDGYTLLVGPGLPRWRAATTAGDRRNQPGM